jgi:hypothetical protein
MQDEGYRFSRRAVERLIDGAVYEWTRDATGRGTWVADPEIDVDAHLTWAGLASAFEQAGWPDSEGALLVMDLERALHLLARLHPDAATVVATRVLNDLSDDEMDAAMPTKRGGPNWRRLRSKAAAWITSYLSGSSTRECEAAYRRAR